MLCGGGGGIEGGEEEGGEGSEDEGGTVIGVECRPGCVLNPGHEGFCQLARDEGEEFEALGDQAAELAREVETLPISVRAFNGLEAAGIKTIAELLAWSPANLLRIEGFGKVCLHEVTEILAERGLKLAGETMPGLTESAVEVGSHDRIAKHRCTYKGTYTGSTQAFHCRRPVMEGTDRCFQHQRGPQSGRLVPRLLKQLEDRRAVLVESIEAAQANLAEIDEAIGLLGKAVK